MADSTSLESDSREALSALVSLREQVRFVRRSIWFPLVVFGVLTLLSAPLYWRYNLSAADCNFQVTTSCASTLSNSPLSGVLDPGYRLNGLSPWLTPYWVCAFVVGYGLSIWYLRLRAKRVGVRGRMQLAVAIGGILVLAVTVTNLLIESLTSRSVLVNDVWIRGTASLVLLAIFFVVMAIIERSFSFVIYALVFLGVALLSSLYDVSNLFNRVGIDGPFTRGGEDLPNILLPAAYLIVGGISYWLLQRRRLHSLLEEHAAETPGR